MKSLAVTLTLTCEASTHDAVEFSSSQSFSQPTEAACLRLARAHGWRVVRGTDFCPHCAANRRRVALDRRNPESP